MISDPATLDDASKAEVRRHFQSWRAGRSEERDGPGATRNRTKGLPRFKHCLYVDRRCLDTLAKMPDNYFERQRTDSRLESNVVVVIIDGRFEERPRGGPDGDYPGVLPDVEGCTERYVGWRYEDVDLIVTTYDESHIYGLSHQAYKRPPLISPFGHGSMPT